MLSFLQDICSKCEGLPVTATPNFFKTLFWDQISRFLDGTFHCVKISFQKLANWWNFNILTISLLWNCCNRCECHDVLKTVWHLSALKMYKHRSLSDYCFTASETVKWPEEWVNFQAFYECLSKYHSIQ